MFSLGGQDQRTGELDTSAPAAVPGQIGVAGIQLPSGFCRNCALLVPAYPAHRFFATVERPSRGPRGLRCPVAGDAP